MIESLASIPGASRTPSLVSRPDRERLLGQRGLVAWLTGLSGSGKTELARGAEAPLMVDSYRRNRATGSLILADESTGATVGAFMVL